MDNGNAFNFTQDRGDILNALLESKHNGTVLALAVPAIGSGIFITAVDDVFGDGEETGIILKTHDITGFEFERNSILLKEVVSVCPLHSPWAV